MMIKLYLKFHAVSFAYDASAEQLFNNISFHVTCGWTGVVGPNGTGKSTLLKLASGLLDPASGSVEHPSHSIYCHQRTDDPPDQINAFLSANSKEVNILKEQLRIEDDWGKRWHTLSHGERKRIQLGVALWQNPDLLAIDEPTNHLDSYASGLIFCALSDYKGIGLLVSHDRELLDKLCVSCVFTIPPAIIMRPGGITQASTAVHQEKNTIQRQYDIKKLELKKARRLVASRKQEAQQADRKRSKRDLAPKDHDGREKIDRARVSGKDGQAGKLSRQLQGRLNQMQEQFDGIKIEKRRTVGIWLPGSISKRDHVLQLQAGIIRMGGGKELFYPDLFVKPNDRIAITGPNGAGKSTLIRYLLKKLNVEISHVTYVPQEIDIKDSKQILDKALALSGDKLGHLMSVVSCLNSRPERLLSTAEPSPGEIRKLLLALGMSHEPHVIIMDEPTNHLDLPSIECLENALSDCPCAMILVSHDTCFLKRLTNINWMLAQQEKGISFKLEVN
jgi:macrolide transport system ATP-binding/permease protein